MTFSKTGKAVSILITIIAYTIAVVAAILSPKLIAWSHPLLIIAVADFVATVVVFIFSRVFNNSSMYDPYWSVKPAVILVFYMLIFDGYPTSYHYAVAFFVILYAVRLTMNFYRGWPGLKHEDWRYVNFRTQFPKTYWLVSFGGIHMFPTLMVYLGCLPLFIIFNTMEPECTILFYTGIIVLAGSIALAYFADEQKMEFTQHPEHKNKSLQTGLWKYCRHPNYLGEILTWWGLFVLAISFTFSGWWTVIGAVAITVMFILASIPMIETRMLSKRADYKDYQKRTPMLLPFLK